MESSSKKTPSSVSTTRPAFLTRSTSPTRVNFSRLLKNPTRNQTQNQNQKQKPNSNPKKKTCLCSPTTHPGSFRCSLHKSINIINNNNNNSNGYYYYYCYNGLNARRSAMTNSLVEGGLVRRALSALIRPSSHQLRRRRNFTAMPSRLRFMSRADDDDDDR